MIRRSFAGAAVAALLLAPTVGRAQVTPYTTLSAWQAASTQTSLFDFEGIAPALGNVASPTLTPLTVTLTGGDDSSIRVYGGNANGGNFSLDGTSSLVLGLNHTSPAVVTIQFGSSATAAATDFGFRSAFGTGPDTNSALVQLFNGATPVGSAFNTGSLATGFFGFTSTSSFDSMVVTTPNLAEDYQTFDNVRLGAAAATPEPGAYALLTSLGLATGGIMRRRRLSRRPTAVVPVTM